MYKTGVLNNGIRIVHKQVYSEVSHCGIIINAGSRDEQNHQLGIAHFIEHMLFKGTKKRKAFHVLSRLDDIGGEIDAFTTKEETCISASFMNKFYERTIELFNDVVFNSVFPDKEIQKEKLVVYDEINSYKDSPSELIYDEFEEMLFTGHPLGNNILGDEKCLADFDKNYIFEFVKENYRTNNMVFCSIGNIEFNKLLKLCEKHFGQNEPTISSCKREIYKNGSVNRKVVEKNVHQAHGIVGTYAYSFFHQDRTILSLISNLLAGNGMNSRLNLSLREKHGISYNIESNYNAFVDTGVFNIYFSSDKNKIEKCKDLIYKELDRLKQKKLGPIQLSKVKKQMQGQIAISNEVNSQQLLSMGKYFLLFDDIDTYQNIYRRIENVSSIDILRVANDLFYRDLFSELIYI